MIQETRIGETTETDVRRMPAVSGAYGATTLPGVMMRLSWGALVAGAVVAIAAQALLSVLGLAIGLSLAPVTPAEGLAVGAGIWWVITALISLFIGGYVAGRFSYIRHPFHSSMHGIMTWCLVTVLSIFFVGWMGGVVAAGPLGAIVDDLIPQQHQQAYTGATAQQQQLQRQQGAEDLRQPDLEALVPGDVDPEATAIGTAWWTFIALLLGVCAAGFGGYLAAPQNIRETTGGLRGTARSANQAE